MKNSLSGLAGIVAAAAVALGVAGAAAADPVDVSYTVSGSAGAWLFDFSVTNNLGGANDLYLFGVRLPVQNETGTPTGWDSTISPGGLNWFGYGGSAIDYNNNWLAAPGGGFVIGAGETLSGFKVLDTSGLPLPSAVSWFSVSVNGTYTGPGCDFACGPPHSNLGFEGLAMDASSAAVPEPTAWAIMIMGFGLAGGALRRRPRAAQI